jgi:hypothetical protein
MKKRNLLAVFLLSILTFGIYNIYWLVKTKKELNSKTKIHVMSIWLLLLPAIVFIVALIVGLVVGFSSGNTQTSGGAGIAVILIDIFAWIILFPIMFFWFFGFSKAVNEYTDGRLSTALTFLLFFSGTVLGIFFAQDTFNEMIDQGIEPGQALRPTNNFAPSPNPTALAPQPLASNPVVDQQNQAIQPSMQANPMASSPSPATPVQSNGFVSSDVQPMVTGEQVAPQTPPASPVL